ICCDTERGSGKGVFDRASSLKSSAFPVTDQQDEFQPTGAAQTVEFTIVLRKTASCSRLGLDVDLLSDCLLVTRVEAGLADMWNQANPDSQLRVGDRIVRVNGLSKDVDAMTASCKSHTVLEMVVQRVG
ncbi:unnamed protein product, partial [Polarella glacialis]